MLVFLGSGVSLASGLPSVVQLTDRLLNDLHEEPQADKRGVSIQKAQAFLKFLVELDSHYLSTIGPYKSGGKFTRTGAIYRASTSYEDLFYLCEQIMQSGLGLADDAPTGALVDIIEQRAGDLLEGAFPSARIMYLSHLARRASNLIEAVVSEQLHSESIEGLDLVLELARSEEVGKLDIVTLNHDTLVEQLLTQHNLEYVDGFGPSDGDARWYDDSLYDRDDQRRIRIVKPHGSIDWYIPSVEGKPRSAILAANSDGVYHNAAGQELRISSKKPSFLTGGNKTLAYNRGIFSEMLSRFHLMLREHQSIIMSGYGWSDSGINFRITNWLDMSRNNSLMLLHETPDELAESSLQLDEYYKALVDTRQLIPGGCWLSDISLSELKVLWERESIE